MSNRKQIEDIIRLLDKKHKVVHNGGKTAQIDGKVFPINSVREATHKRFVQRVIRRHKESVGDGNRTELPTGPATEPQATAEDQGGSEREAQGS